MRHKGVILLLIILLAAFLRLVELDRISPPGLNQDEAANAWSAYCLLKTGKDYAGVSWPIFYTRNVGGNSSTLYVYLLLPFQAIGGLNIYTTRLPAAIGGVITVWLIYFVGRRLFGPATAIAAAAFLAIDPWQIQHSRNGLESSITPLATLVPLAFLLWAGLPAGDDNKTASPRPLVAVLGGALTGIGCYGHWEIRLFVPAFLLLAVLFTLPRWRQTIKAPKGLLTLALFFIAFAATYGPLIWQHIFHPEGIARHLSFSPDRINNAPLFEAVKNVTLRYVRHFGPRFLFIAGDSDSPFSPQGMGLFYWYMAPLMLAGLVSLLRRFKSSLSAKFVIAFILVYPVGDCLIWRGSLNILRSTPGLCGLVLLASVGAVDSVRWLWKWNCNAAKTTAVVFILVAGTMNVHYLRYFYGQYNRQPEIYHYFHADFVEACEWLRPRFNDFDAVFCTSDFNMPYVISVVVLGYDPHLWFSQPRDFVPIYEYDYYTRYGKMYFMYPGLFNMPANQYGTNRTLFIVRPGETNIPEHDRRIIHKIFRPDGEEVLWICRL